MGPEAQSPAFQAGEELLKAGLRQWALVEFRRVINQQGADPIILYWLTSFFEEKGLYSLSVATGERLFYLSPASSLREAPLWLQRILYPFLQPPQGILYPFSNHLF